MTDRTIETEAETTEDAIEAALAELGVDRDQAQIEILEEPNKGLLGLRKAKARVKVTVLDNEAVAKTVMEETLRALGAEASISVQREGDEFWLTLAGDSLAWLIGHHGYTLDAVQTLVQAIISRRTKAAAKIVVDIEGYRARRKKEIQAVAERTIGKALARQEAISLRPMNAFERKVVHLVAGEYEGVTSASTGVDPNRFVIISPTRE